MAEDGESKPARFSGGCQCGAVRYEVRSTPQGVHYCHCRMCQRAVGNVFAGLAPVRKAHLRWTDEEPSFFASSTVARRGFCARCGTPLTFAYNESEWICVTLGSLDHPAAFTPTIEYGIEARLPYVRPHDDWQQKRTEPSPRTAGMVNNQFQADEA